MTLTTIKKIIAAVINNCPDLDSTAAHEFDKICVDDVTAPELRKSIYGGIYAPMNCDGNKAVIFHPSNGDIAIYKPVHFNGVCVGYRFITYIETALKTQLDVTAELMYIVSSISTTYIIDKVRCI